MAINSKIQWTKATWNPWHGCKKVSEGCKYCYMYRDKDRYGHDPTEVLRSKTKFNAPLKWAEASLIFTCSWSDFFIQEADLWRDEAWDIIRRTPRHTYQILTKRPERIAECLPEDWGEEGYPNVWMGISAETQQNLDRRLPHLLNVPAQVRFISAEPLLEYVNLLDAGMVADSPLNDRPLVDWVIIGGESGNDTGKWKYRPCEAEWIQNMVMDCQALDIPYFIKQLGTHLATKVYHLSDRHGGDLKEWPTILTDPSAIGNPRQMPKIYQHV